MTRKAGPLRLARAVAVSLPWYDARDAGAEPKKETVHES